MSVRQYEEERQKCEQFLKRENEALNRHKGELIDKVWALESENKRLREALENVQEQLFTIRGKNALHDGEITGLCIQIRQALEGDTNA